MTATLSSPEPWRSKIGLRTTMMVALIAALLLITSAVLAVIVAGQSTEMSRAKATIASQKSDLEVQQSDIAGLQHSVAAEKTARGNCKQAADYYAQAIAATIQAEKSAAEASAPGNKSPLISQLTSNLGFQNAASLIGLAQGAICK